MELWYKITGCKKKYCSNNTSFKDWKTIVLLTYSTYRLRLRDLDLETERPEIADLERERETDLESERERRLRLYERERDREAVYDLFILHKLIRHKINLYKYVYKSPKIPNKKIILFKLISKKIHINQYKYTHIF